MRISVVAPAGAVIPTVPQITAASRAAPNLDLNPNLPNISSPLGRIVPKKDPKARIGSRVDAL